MEQPEWMRHAWLAYGEKEIPGRRDNGEILQFYADVGHGSVVHDEVAWCAAFLGSCLERAGRISTRSLMARSYLKWGEPLAESQLGAIAVLSRGANQALGHVGFVVRADESTLYLLGGNQSNQVKISRFDRSRLLGFRWPAPNQDRSGDDRGKSPAVSPRQNDNHSATGFIVSNTNTNIDTGKAEEAVFEVALAHVLQMEGGYSDDPHDPGGATNYGITIADFARARAVSLSANNLAKLKRKLRDIKPGEVRRIYQARYWRRASCGALPSPLAIMHFDCAVNQGVGRATPFLQQAVGTQVDGEIGPLTIGAANKACATTASITSTLKIYADLRRRHYRGLGHFWRFGRGWLRRLDKTLDLAQSQIPTYLAQRADLKTGTGLKNDNETQPKQRKTISPMAIKKEAIKVKPIQKSAQKAAQSAVPKTTAKIVLPTKWWGESMTIWGTILTAASTILPILGPLVGLDISADLVQELGEQVTQMVKVTGGVIGLLMTIYGRSRATHQLVRREVKLMM